MIIGKKFNQKYRTHDFFCEKSNKFFLVHRTFQNIKRNITSTSKCKEDRKLLITNKKILTNTSLANFCLF